MTKLKHIIFDMDGTLSDTAKATGAAIRQVEKLFDAVLKTPGELLNYI